MGWVVFVGRVEGWGSDLCFAYDLATSLHSRLGSKSSWEIYFVFEIIFGYFTTSPNAYPAATDYQIIWIGMERS